MTLQWLTDLRISPTKAVSDALAGMVDFGRFQRADTDDAIANILDGVDDPKPHMDSLAKGIWGWLEARRRFSAADRDAYGLDPFVREVREALIIAQRLDLILVTKNILKDFWGWENWCEKLLLRHASRDARLQLLKLCAVHQQVLDDSSLEPRWIQYCRDAGTAVPLSYLDVALLGLRALPRRASGDDLAVRATFGLALWAASYHPSKDEFLEYWSSLRHLMPRSDPIWRTIIEDAIENVCRYTSLRDPETAVSGPGIRLFGPASWLREGFKAPKRPVQQRGRGQAGSSGAVSKLYQPPQTQEAHDLAKLVRFEFSNNVRETAHDLFDRHEQWVRYSGNCWYYQQALAITTPSFLRSKSAGATELVIYYIRRALMWDEQHDTLWNLWQRCLLRLGQEQLAENVAWEAVRRFPEDVETRTQLAQLLVKFDRRREGEALLKEVSHMAGQRPTFYMVLGKILAADKHRRDEACELMVAANERIPGNHNMLVFTAQLQLYLGHLDIASELLDQAEEAVLPPNSPTPHYYAACSNLAFREEGREEAGKWLDVGLQAHPGNVELLAKKKKYYAGEDVSALDEELLATEAETPDGQREDSAAEAASGDSNPAMVEEEQPVAPHTAASGPPESSGTTVAKDESKDSSAKPGSPAQSAASEQPASAGQTAAPGRSASPDHPVSPEQPASPDRPASAASAPAAASEQKVTKEPAATNGSKPTPKPRPDNALVQVAMHGRAKRADFALNGAGLRGPARRAAQVDLEDLTRKNPEFLYGQVVHQRRMPSSKTSPLNRNNVPIAIEIGMALESKDSSVLRRIAKTGDEGLLADLAIALAGDAEAQQRWRKGIPKVSMHGGYASQILQRLIADLGTTNVPREDRDEFRLVWTTPVDINEFKHFFFQAVDASLRFSVADDSIRLGSR